MKCPQCGYISFDHLETCRKCGYALVKNQDLKLPLKSGKKAAYTKPYSQTSLPKKSSDLKPFDQSHKETLMPKKVGTKRIGNLTEFSDENKYENKLDVHAIPQESIKENEIFHNESVFFQESMSCEEDAGQDAAFTPESSDMIGISGRNGDIKDLAKGGFWIRTAAFISDILIIIFLESIFAYAVKFGIITGARIMEMKPQTFFDLRESLITIIGTAIFAFYFIYFHAKTGQTIGKMLFHLKVVRADGSPVDSKTAVKRFLGYFASALPLYVGFIFIAFSKEKRGFHDMIAQTYVIKIS